MKEHITMAQNNAVGQNSIADRMKPLNFSAKSFSKQELEQAVKQTKSAESSCGLCKIVLGSG